MKYQKFFLLFLFLTSFGSIYGVVEHTMDEKKPIDVIFSKNSHNRIAISQSSIEKIFGDENFFKIWIDSTTGNAFVKVKRDITNPTTLTVVTSSRFIQDLYVISDDIPSEHLILKEDSHEEEEIMSKFSTFHTTTVEFLNQIFENKTPLGYRKREIIGLTIPDLPKPLEIEIIQAFENSYESIVVYKVKNSGKTSIVLSSDAFKKNDVNWVFLNANELKAKEEVVCIMSTFKREM